MPDRPLGLGGPRSAPIAQRWDPGDRLLLYTDGLVEARDAARKFFPMASLGAALSAQTVEDSLDVVWDELHRHVGGEPRDDVALLLAERLADGT